MSRINLTEILISSNATIILIPLVVILTIKKGFGKINLSIEEIIISGAAITAVWIPTFISIITDKIKERI